MYPSQERMQLQSVSVGIHAHDISRRCYVASRTSLRPDDVQTAPEKKKKKKRRDTTR